MQHKTKTLALALTAAITSVAALAPIEAQAQSFAFNKNRPRLVMLLHGVTPRPDQDAEAMIGTSGHARYYWGFNFIKGLQGRTDETQMRVFTPRLFGSMHFKNTVAADWTPYNSGSQPSDYAPICFPVSWWSNLPAGIETNATIQKDYIRLMTKNAGANTTMVMVNSRDGSRSFNKQVGEAIDELYMSYTIAFNHLPIEQQPQIYMVCHSWGGMVARGIMANPTGADLFANKLTASQRTRATFLRDRTVLIKTLGTPHQGTYIPDLSGDIHDLITAVGPTIISRYFGFIASQPWRNYSADWVKSKTASTMNTIVNAVSGKRDSLDDITNVASYNAGLIHPNTQRRSDGTLVPIYTAAGRNPGGMVYDQSRSVFLLGGGQWNPISNLDIAMNSPRYGTEAMALNIIESLSHLKGYGKEGKKPWGTAHVADGDRVASPHRGLGPTTAKSFNSGIAIDSLDVKWLAQRFFEGKPYLQGVADGEYDSDGFLGWDSAHAINLSGTGQNWYRVYPTNKYGGQLPWDVDNHGSMMFNAGNGTWIHNELLREAGPYALYAGARRSSWATGDVPVTPSKGVKIEFPQIHDIVNDLDYLSGADFTLRIRVGATEKSINLADNTRTVSAPTFYFSGFASPIIPIRIDVVERDTPDPNDLCLVSPFRNRSSVFLYWDTRTQRVLGDYSAGAGETITMKPSLTDFANRVQMQIRVLPY